MGSNVDDMIMIPFTTAKYLGTDTSINNLYIKIQDENNIDKTTKIIENYVSSSLGITTDYFSVSSQDSMLDTMESVNNTLSLLLGGIASISLVVGGIGVMNVMLVSVTERTKEIGIRKALRSQKKRYISSILNRISSIMCMWWYYRNYLWIRNRNTFRKYGIYILFKYVNSNNIIFIK